MSSKGKGKADDASSAGANEQRDLLPWYVPASHSVLTVNTNAFDLAHQGGKVPPGHAGRPRVSQGHYEYK